MLLCVLISVLLPVTFSLKVTYNHECAIVEISNLSELHNANLLPKTCMEITIKNYLGAVEELTIDKFKIPFRNITKLKINGGLKHVSPYFFKSYLGNLKTISLKNNNLETLGPHIFRNITLNRLELRSNNITYTYTPFYNSSIYDLDMSFNSIEDVLYLGLSEMELFHVSLAGNSITRMSCQCFPRTVKSINLNYNILQHITKRNFGNLENLEILYLSHNLLHSVDFDITLLKLEVLDLSYNFFTVLDENSISPLKSLKYLNLRRNFLKSLADNFLQLLPKLTKLDISYNYITNFPFKDLASLQVMYIYGNPWTCRCLYDIETSFSKEVVTKDTFCNLISIPKSDPPLCIAYGEECSKETNETMISDFVYEVSTYAIECRNLYERVDYKFPN